MCNVVKRFLKLLRQPNLSLSLSLSLYMIETMFNAKKIMKYLRALVIVKKKKIKLLKNKIHYFIRKSRQIP